MKINAHLCPRRAKFQEAIRVADVGKSVYFGRRNFVRTDSLPLHPVMHASVGLGHEIRSPWQLCSKPFFLPRHAAV